MRDWMQVITAIWLGWSSCKTWKDLQCNAFHDLATSPTSSFVTISWKSHTSTASLSKESILAELPEAWLPYDFACRDNDKETKNKEWSWLSCSRGIERKSVVLLSHQACDKTFFETLRVKMIFSPAVPFKKAHGRHTVRQYALHQESTGRKPLL